MMDTILGLLRNPAMFISMIACLGLVLQKKSISDIMKGTFKTFIGMIVLTKGVDIIIAGITPLSNAFVRLFAIEGAKPLGDFSQFLNEYGTMVGIIMLIGFICNILIARFTKFKTIFLTANLLYWSPMLFLAVGIEGGLSGAVLIGFAVVFHVIYITIFPYLMKKHVKMVTGNDSFTIGHTCSIFCIMGSWIGRFIGDKNKSTEELKLPASLDFLRDTTITSGIIIAIVHMIVGGCVGADIRAEVFGGQPLAAFAIIQGMTFAAGMIILLQGVRMMLAEIVPAFKGVADKLVPGAVPALDIPLIFPYAPTALLLGFIIAVVVSISTLFIMGSMGVLKVAIIPLVVACYFDVAPAAIFANARGGRLAAVVTSVAGGAMLTVLVAVSLPMVANTVGTFVQAYGGNEYSMWIIIANAVAKLLGGF